MAGLSLFIMTNNRQQVGSSHTAGLNVDLDPFFELAELMVEMS